ADWWTSLASPELNRVVTAALAGNRTLAAAQATLAQARELVAAETGKRFPEVTLSANVGRQKLGARFLGPQVRLPPFTFFSIGPSVSYALDYTGGVERSIEQQQALEEYQAQRLRAAHLELTGNIVMQSLAIAAARAEIAAVETILERDRATVDLVRTAFQAG